MNENKKIWKLYKHTNKINGKCYIGITSYKNPNYRWGKEGKGYEGQSFYKAIKKYGWDNFEHEILENNLTEEEAKNKEIELIKYYDSNNTKYGYNITSGGNSGIKWTEDLKKNKSLSMKDGLNPTAVSVIYNGIEFETISLCAEHLKVGRNKIKRWLNGITIIPNKIYENGLSYKDKSSNNFKLESERKTKKQGTLVLYNNKVYNSIKECALDIGVEKNALGSWLNGKSGIKKNYEYVYYNGLSIYGEKSKVRLADYSGLINSNKNRIKKV